MDKTVHKIETLYDLERYDEVVKLCVEKLYQSDADQEVLYSKLIEALIKLERYEEADTFCQEAIAAYPSNSDYHYLYSYIYENGYSAYKEAMQCIETALHIHPNNPQYLAQKATLLYRQNRPFDAKVLMEEVLELDAADHHYHLLYGLILYDLDGAHVTQEIIDDVLRHDPNHAYALYLKQALFTSKLKKRESLLKNLLFHNPLDETYLKEIGFIKFYYRYIPWMMLAIIGMDFWMQYYRYHDILSTPLFLMAVPVALIGSQDWRFNVPFLAALVALDAYFNIGGYPRKIEFGELFYIIFQAGLLHLVTFGLFRVAKGIVYQKDEKIKALKFHGKNAWHYFIVQLPFVENGEIDHKAYQRYYQMIVPLMLLSIGLFIVYNHYADSYQDAKILIVSLFFIVAVLGAKNFLFDLVYIVVSWSISRDYAFDFVMLLGASLLYVFLINIHHFIFYRKKHG